MYGEIFLHSSPNCPVDCGASRRCKSHTQLQACQMAQHASHHTQPWHRLALPAAFSPCPCFPNPPPPFSPENPTSLSLLVSKPIALYLSLSPLSVSALSLISSSPSPSLCLSLSFLTFCLSAVSLHPLYVGHEIHKPLTPAQPLPQSASISKSFCQIWASSTQTLMFGPVRRY